MFEIQVVAHIDSRVNLIERFDFSVKGKDLVDLKSQVMVRIYGLIKRLEVKGNYVHCDVTIQKDEEWYDSDYIAIAITTGEVE